MKTPFVIAGAYAALAGTWIYTSDRILASLSWESADISQLQTVKGWVFVAVTTTLLYAALYTTLRRRERSEQKLLAEQRKFRALVNQTLVGIYIIQEGKFFFVNPQFAEIFGYSQSEILSLPSVLELVAESSRKLVSDNIQRRLRGKTRKLQYQFEGLHKDGSIIEVEVVGSRTTLDEGPVIVGTLMDITQRKQLEEQFVQAQKMEVVGTLAGGVAHDFNNILTGIGGYTQLLLEKAEPRSQLGKDLLEIQALTNRATGLTRQLLMFSRRQKAEQIPLDPNETIENLLKMLRRLIGEHIDLQFVPGSDLHTVRGDPGQIEQILMNLAVNARDAMPGGGRLIIETANVELGREYAETHFQVEPGEYVMINVSDNGHGMDRETRQRIFEPFFTTKEKGKGTGLGLSTVYSIVKQHDGHIWVYSEPGHGTTFKVYLPSVKERVATASDERDPETLPEGSETILLVEDEPAVRTLMERILRGLGYRVLVASDPAEAETIFEQQEKAIHLLVTDIVMPGRSGQELYDALCRRKPELKVLYMSGYTDTAIRKNHALAEGASYIQKPFRPIELARRIRELLDG